MNICLAGAGAFGIKHIEALATPEEVAKNIQRELAPIREKHFGKVAP